MITAIGLVVLAYIFGSLPFGYWVAKLFQGEDFDIRDWGSNNIGFTNVKRVLGWRAGIPVLVLDFLKGFAPTKFADYYYPDYVVMGCLLAALIGHAYSIYFYIIEDRFSGGKSVATAFGGIVAAQPIVAITSLIVFSIILAATKYLSLGSIIGAFSACVTSVYLLQQNRTSVLWVICFTAIFLMIIFTHRRNIARLIDGVEPKFNEKRGVHGIMDEALSVFVVHSITLADLAQSKMTNWVLNLVNRGWLSPRAVRKMLRYAPVLEFGEIKGIIDNLGNRARVLIFGVPLLPEQLMDERNKQLVEEYLKRATVLAQRRGATVIGLGALLSSASEGGRNLQKWAREQRKLTIEVDNGGTFTAAATIMALRQITSTPLNQLSVAVIGGTGIIGSAIVRYLQGENRLGSIKVYGRNEYKLAQFQDLTHVLTTTDLAEIGDADVIISATSSPRPIFTLENHRQYIKNSAIFLDVAVPDDFDDRILTERPDIKLVRAGMIILPGDYKSTVDFHFGAPTENGKTKILVPACLSQSVILSITQNYQMATRGAMIRPREIDWFMNEAQEKGFRVVVSDIGERAFFSGLKDEGND